jgi:hypothetical protein
MRPRRRPTNPHVTGNPDEGANHQPGLRSYTFDYGIAHRAAAMRVKLGSVGYLKAADRGYGIGLDDDGRRIEFLGDRQVLALATVGEYMDVADFQVLAVDDELRLPLSRLALAERDAFLRLAFAETRDKH